MLEFILEIKSYSSHTYNVLKPPFPHGEDAYIAPKPPLPHGEDAYNDDEFSHFNDDEEFEGFNKNEDPEDPDELLFCTYVGLMGFSARHPCTLCTAMRVGGRFEDVEEDSLRCFRSCMEDHTAFKERTRGMDPEAAKELCKEYNNQVL